jgi:tetratricopeptide (TPR) repeat protein
MNYLLRHGFFIAASVTFACWLISPASAQVEAAAKMEKQVVALREAGKYAEAIALEQQELPILERAVGPDHPYVAIVLNNLGALYRYAGHYPDAEPVIKRALALEEKTYGPDNPNTAMAMSNLAGLYQDEGRYADAEPLFRRSLAIREKALGPDNIGITTGLNNLAMLYMAQGRYAEAEPLLKRALEIREVALGPDHPDVMGHERTPHDVRAAADFRGSFRGRSGAPHQARISRQRLSVPDAHITPDYA